MCSHFISLKVTTHSRLLSASDAEKIGIALHISKKALKLISLQSFNTEHQFSKTLRSVDASHPGVSVNERKILRS